MTTGAALPVLVVGGGPAGLTAACLLADHGVPVVLVERNPSTTDHPRAHVVNTRTMEIFRALGIADAVRAAGLPAAATARILWKRTLAGAEYGALEMRAARAAERAAASPTAIASCAQDRVEALLREAAARRGCDLRYGTEAVAYAPDDDGVTVTVRTAGGARAGRAPYAPGGTDWTLRAAWVIAADGAASPARRLLGVGMTGLPPLATLTGIHFEADLEPWVRDRPGILCFVMNRTAPGIVIALDGRRRWVFHCLVPAEGLDDAAAAGLVRAAVGVPDLAVAIRSIRPWTMTAEVAERFRVGRVFLAGDAAHRFPPTGGFGLNTGVQDVHNLAWKLARVIAGRAPAALLDTYETERKPVAQSNTDWSVRNFVDGGSAVGPGNLMATMQLEAGGADVPAVLAQLRADIERERDHFDALGQDLGFAYETGALVPDGTALPAVADRAADYVPNARPGSRAPHVWLRRRGGAARQVVDGGGGGETGASIVAGQDVAGGASIAAGKDAVAGRDVVRDSGTAGEMISTLDLFGRDFVLLVPTTARAWLGAGEALYARGLHVIRIGPGGDAEAEAGDWRVPFGIGPDGAVLVRPDGHVAWRAQGRQPDAVAALAHALAVAGGDGREPQRLTTRSRTCSSDE